MSAMVPDYMVPATYIELAQLPLNHNLKVDRRALPGRSADREARASARRLPETATERCLAAIWQDVIKGSQVGLDDHFLDLGADSLLAMEMTVRVERELHVVIEGMDVLRESLEMIAAICDRKLGVPVAKPARRPAPRGVSVETFHFGDLFGVLYGGGSSSEGVLICPPIGQEGVRAHYVLARLAGQLAERGRSVLLFDYEGLGNSGGDSRDANPLCWQQSIVKARAELIRRSRATRITAIGVRLGATLLCTAGIATSQLVLWDPIAHGSAWFLGQVAMHRRYLRSQRALRRWRSTGRILGGEEHLGVTYSHSAVRDLMGLSIRRIPDTPVRWLATFDTAMQRASCDAITERRGRFEPLALDCGWTDLARFEDMVPNVGVADKLATMVVEP
jgi:acyl carrier protein